jgi:hypothetical protein
MRTKQLLYYAMCLLMAGSLSGCLYAAAAGAGAYGGYKAKEKGYWLQSPVKKDGPKDTERHETK